MGVIDKSVIDCLHCCEGGTQVVRRYVDEVFRILAPGGVFLAVSCHTKPSMMAVLRGRDWEISKVVRMSSLEADDDEAIHEVARESVVTISVCVKSATASDQPPALVLGSKKRTDKKKAQKLERRIMRASLEEAEL